MTAYDHWRANKYPGPMRRQLPYDSSERKLRLWACACCRRIWHLVTDPRCHRSVEVAEQDADGFATPGDIERARRGAVAAADEANKRYQGYSEACAAETAFYLASFPVKMPGNYPARDNPEQIARSVLEAVLFAVDPQTSTFYPLRTPVRDRAEQEESAAQIELLLDIFGNPFQPISLEPTWLSSTVRAMAIGIYAERAFDRLPILADALEEAGCDNLDILNHCRGPGPHVLGCWVVDLLLGKHA